MKEERKGFTLIELMIVMSIIGVLAALAMPYYSNARERARRGKCYENSALLSRMSELYNIENKEYPGELKDMAPLLVGQRLPACPSHGVYRWVPGTENGLPYGKKVECSIHGCASEAFGG